MQDLLFLSHRIPYPPDKGDKIRSWNFFRHLAGRYRMHLACFIDDPNDRQHIPLLQDMCVESFFAELSPKLARLKSLRRVATGEALTVGYFHSRAMERWIGDVVLRRKPEQAFIFCTGVAHFLLPQRYSGLRRVIDFVDVDSDKWRQYASRQSWPLSLVYQREARKLLEFERKVAREFAASLFVSAREAALFRDLAPESAARIHPLDNGVDFEYFSPERSYDNPYGSDGPVIAFTGAMDYWPNRDAVTWFAEEVLPQVQAKEIRLQFAIVGANPSPEVRRLAKLPGIIVTGRVPDVRPYLAHATVVVAPLRVARGVQNKVLEAMAMARPVVVTPQALEGIEAQPGRHLLVAEAASDFASALASLVHDRGRHAMGRNARERVIAGYGWDASLARLDSMLDGAVLPESKMPALDRAAATG